MPSKVSDPTLATILRKLDTIERFANAAEKRLTAIEGRLTMVEGGVATLDLNLNRKLVEHGGLLEAIATEVKGLRQERAAHQAAHDRFEARDAAFAKKLKLDLDRIDAAA